MTAHGWRCIAMTIAMLTLVGCSVFRDAPSGAYFEDDGPPNASPDPSTVADAVPRAEPGLGAVELEAAREMRRVLLGSTGSEETRSI